MSCVTLLSAPALCTEAFACGWLPPTRNVPCGVAVDTGVKPRTMNVPLPYAVQYTSDI